MADTKDIIKKLREELNIGQSELADMLDVSPSTISMWETGKRFPTRESCEALADFFNVDIDYIYGRTSIRKGVHLDVKGNKYLALSDLEIELVERFRHADEKDILLFRYILFEHKDLDY